jgi:hypothetical protein
MCSWQFNSSVGRSMPLASSPCSCQGRLLINVQVYANQVCRFFPPTHASFRCDLPPLPSRSVPPRRRPHWCMPVAPPALDCPCAHHDLPPLFLLHLSAGQTRPGEQVPAVNLFSPGPGPPARHLIKAANPATVCSRPRLSECHSPLNV